MGKTFGGRVLGRTACTEERLTALASPDPSVVTHRESKTGELGLPRRRGSPQNQNGVCVVVSTSPHVTVTVSCSLCVYTFWRTLESAENKTSLVSHFLL